MLSAAASPGVRTLITAADNRGARIVQTRNSKFEIRN
jgi:hypothetical protein